MWMINCFGVNAIFDIRGILLAIILFVTDIGISLVVKKFKLLTISIVNIAFVILVSMLDTAIAIESIFIGLFWTLFLLCDHTYRTQCQTSKKKELLFESLAFFATLSIVTIGLAAPARYEINVVTLEPEVETIFYCLDTGEEIPEDTVFEGNLITSASRSYGSEPANDFFAKYLFIDGEKDYVKKTVTTYYTEDRNLDPPIRYISTIENIYIFFIGKDK